jgi:hypothetical protein
MPASRYEVYLQVYKLAVTDSLQGVVFQLGVY